MGLAVADVKLFRLNAKREHLRARIEKSLVLQAKFGLLCELCSRLVFALSKQSCLSCIYVRRFMNYYLWKLELRTVRVDLPVSQTDHRHASNRSSKHHSPRDAVVCQTGYYRHHIDRSGQELFEDNDQKRLIRKTDELRDVFEKANAHIHHELRKLFISFQTEFDEIKRKLIQN